MGAAKGKKRKSEKMLACWVPKRTWEKFHRASLRDNRTVANKLLIVVQNYLRELEDKL